MSDDVCSIPLRWVGPLRLHGAGWDDEEARAPLATYESPLWPSVNRGARATAEAGGIRLVITDDRMSRSVVLRAPSAAAAAAVAAALPGREAEIAGMVVAGSRFARLRGLRAWVSGNLLYVRLEIATGDAAGHNMATRAADQLLGWLGGTFPELTPLSVSGNLCCDKKVSAVNGLLGRGKYVVAETQLPRAIVEKRLKTTPERLADLNTQKNLVGSILAGSLRSANAHYANMLLAFYLATGQDAANIVEGSQGITQAETRADGLYFSCTLPNVIVGTVGNGKDTPGVRERLRALGCLEARAPGENARRLAGLAAAVTLCGELSLLAAQTNPGELMRAHLALERRSAAAEPT